MSESVRKGDLLDKLRINKYYYVYVVFSFLLAGERMPRSGRILMTTRPALLGLRSSSRMPWVSLVAGLMEVVVEVVGMFSFSLRIQGPEVSDRLGFSEDLGDRSQH